MKNYLKLFIPAMLLLITTSAFAQEKPTVEEEQQKALTTILQEAYNEDNKSFVDTLDELCKGNKYCNANVILLSLFTDSKKTIKAALSKETDPKQALYVTKYNMLKDENKFLYVYLLEHYQISKLSTYQEVKDFLDDMPLTNQGFSEAVAKMTQLATYPAELLYSTSLINKSLQGNIKECPKNFHVEDYNHNCYMSSKYTLMPNLILMMKNKNYMGMDFFKRVTNENFKNVAL
jgi:hypothetical protein